MKKGKISLSLILVLALVVSLIFTGCGDNDYGYIGDEEDYDRYSDDDADEGYYDEDYYDESTDAEKDVQDTVREYRTENVIPEYDDSGVQPVPIDINVYCDYSALEHAKETGTEDYLNWLCDTVINKYAPQAVQKLLTIPEFKEGAESGLLSRYTTFNLTYNPQTGFGAITLAMPVLEDGSAPTDDMETATIYNISHLLAVNTSEFGPETMDDVGKQAELQSTLLHEMMHAFMYSVRRGQPCAS